MHFDLQAASSGSWDSEPSMSRLELRELLCVEKQQVRTGGYAFWLAGQSSG